MGGELSAARTGRIPKWVITSWTPRAPLLPVASGDAGSAGYGPGDAAWFQGQHRRPPSAKVPAAKESFRLHRRRHWRLEPWRARLLLWLGLAQLAQLVCAGRLCWRQRDEDRGSLDDLRKYFLRIASCRLKDGTRPGFARQDANLSVPPSLASRLSGKSQPSSLTGQTAQHRSTTTDDAETATW